MFIASNGYEYEGYEYESLESHKMLADDGCLNCHFNDTQNYVLGGHSFNMEAMLGGEEVLHVAACNNCHNDLEDFNHEGAQSEVDELSAQLLALLLQAGLMEVGEDEIHPTEELTTSADSAGAVWNYLFVHEDQSHGIHNSEYAIGLLESAILFMEGTLPDNGAPSSMSRYRLVQSLAPGQE
jgi:hypothetical protein